MAQVIKSGDPKNPQQQSKMFWDVLRKHLAIFGEHYRQPISELSVIAYAEDLVSLTPEQLDAACSHARKTSEFMPVSAVILRAHGELEAMNRAQRDRSQYSGPPLEWDPKLEAERLERKAKWERQVADVQKEKSKDLNTQKRELREKGWLQ